MIATSHHDKEVAMRAVLLLTAALLMTGCAANLTKGGSTTPLSIAEDSRKELVVNFTGNDRVLANAKWNLVKNSWRTSLQKEAKAAGYKLSEQVGAIRTQPEPGTILLVEVSNFRHLTAGQRFWFGVMTGNAWVNAKVSYLDLQTGETLGVRTYDTNSSAWEGIFSAMTDEQLEAISKEMIGEIRAANVIARQAPAPAQTASKSSLTKQQELEQLSREGLSYEEYQRRYKAITEQ